jgi:hypothetical protein
MEPSAAADEGTMLVHSHMSQVGNFTDPCTTTHAASPFFGKITIVGTAFETSLGVTWGHRGLRIHFTAPCCPQILHTHPRGEDTPHACQRGPTFSNAETLPRAHQTMDHCRVSLDCQDI